MTYLFNHIQGKNGSQWVKFKKQYGEENIVILAIDAAKFTHKAMICNFDGEILVEAFDFDASVSGFEKARNLVEKERKKHQFKEVVVAIETTGHYYEDLVRLCLTADYHVRVINATITKKERDKLLNYSKTDRLDLMVIVQCLLEGHGTFCTLPSGLILQLQKLTRMRRELVKEETAIKNNILVHIDHIFREYQGKTEWVDGKKVKKRPFYDIFCRASRYIMKHHLHPTDLLKLREEGLRKISLENKLKLRQTTIECLLDLAQNSISRPKAQLMEEQLLLSLAIERLELLEKQIRLLEDKIEDIFLQTDGAIILSIPGVGVVTGAELYAEMDDPSKFDHAGQLIKMAGTNPIVKQSGDRRPSYYAVSKQGRKSFRAAVFNVGRSLSINNPEMKAKYEALKERGKHAKQAYIALGNRMIRLAFAMIKKQTLYQTKTPDYTLRNQLQKKLQPKNIERFYARFIVDPDEHIA